MSVSNLIAAAALAGVSGLAWAQGPEQPPGGDREGRPPQREARDRGPMRSPGAPEEGRVIAPEQVERILRALRENDPERAEKLARVREKNPDEFMRLIREAGEMLLRRERGREGAFPPGAPQSPEGMRRPSPGGEGMPPFGVGGRGEGPERMQMQMQMERLRSENPAEFERLQRMRKMEEETQALAERIRRVESPEEKEKMTGRLRDLLGEMFDQRESGREREVAEMERRVAELRRILKERRDRKDEIVKRRMGQLLGREEVLEW
jgi:hypothetical protein